MKVAKIDSRMRNAEHIQFITEIRDAINKFNPNSLNLGGLFNEFMELYIKEDTAYRTVNKSALTEELQKADEVRDDILRGMTLLVHSCLYHFDENVKQAAKRLQILFDTYGNVRMKPLNEETADITNIIQDLNGTKYIGDVQLTNLTSWIPKLQNANNNFEQIMKNRFAEAAEKPDIILREVRTEIDAVYRKMVERVEVFGFLENEEGADADTDADTDTGTGTGGNINNFIKYINAIIEKYNLIIAQRTKKKN